MQIFWQLLTLRGYSAGSYAGLPLLHNLRELPCIATETVLGAIACPPRLLRFKPDANHSLHLIHCAPDGLCVWYPSKERLNSLKCKYTFVEGNSSVYEHHFGKHEHNYRHWLDLSMAHGTFAIAQVMMWYPEVWFAPELKDLIESLMLQFSQQVHPPIVDSMRLVRTSFTNCSDFKTQEQIRDFVVAELGGWNVTGSLRVFSDFSLPRLVHFLDMILPQLAPAHTRWHNARKPLLRCHFLRLASPWPLLCLGRQNPVHVHLTS